MSGRTRHHPNLGPHPQYVIEQLLTKLRDLGVSELLLDMIKLNYKAIKWYVYELKPPFLFICKKKKWVIVATPDLKLICFDYKGSPLGLRWLIDKRMDFRTFKLNPKGLEDQGDLFTTPRGVLDYFSDLYDGIDPLPQPPSTILRIFRSNTKNKNTRDS